MPIQTISITKLVPDPNQPRKYFDATKMAALRKSVKREGVLQPLTVEAIPKSDKFLIVDGERRYMAAKEEGIKQVPYVVIEVKDPLQRRMQQFQMQELHEGWSAIEKALAIIELSKDLKMPMLQVCEMLGITPRTADRYVSFSRLIEKEKYVKEEVSLEFAPMIISIKALAKKVYAENSRELDKTDERLIEKAVLNRVKSGSISNKHDFTKIKDAITTNPQYLERFIETDITPEQMFKNSEAKPAYYFRNAYNNAGHMHANLEQYLKTGGIKMDPEHLSTFKGAKKTIEKLLAQAE